METQFAKQLSTTQKGSTLSRNLKSVHSFMSSERGMHRRRNTELPALDQIQLELERSATKVAKKKKPVLSRRESVVSLKDSRATPAKTPADPYLFQNTQAEVQGIINECVEQKKTSIHGLSNPICKTSPIRNIVQSLREIDLKHQSQQDMIEVMHELEQFEPFIFEQMFIYK